MSKSYKPQLTYIRYDGVILRAEWQATIPPRFSKFMVKVMQKDGPTWEYPSQGSSWEKELQLSPTQTYTLQVIVMVSGQPKHTSDEVILITSSPHVYSVIYADSLLQLYWAAAQGAGVGGYVATLTEVNKKWNEFTADLRIEFKQTLKIDEKYQVAVQATNLDNTVFGPSSTIYTPIVGAPVVYSVYYVSGKLTLKWEPAGGSGVEAYVATLEGGEENKWNQSTQELTTVFNQELQQTGAYNVVVCASDSSGVVLGPPSTVYTVLVDSPQWSMLAYDSGQMSLTWTPVSDSSVSGYLITVSGLSPSSYSVDSTTPHFSISATLEPLKSYSATVAATNGIVQGPPSQALIPLTAPPLTPTLGYTGTDLRMSWEPSGESNVNGYVIELLSDGNPTENIATVTPPQVFKTPFVSGVVFTARSRATGQETMGPWSTLASGPYQAEIDYTYDSLGRLESIAWGAGFTESYTFDTAGNLTTVTYPKTPSQEVMKGNENENINHPLR